MSTLYFKQPIRNSHCGLTKRAFSPVAGCVRTIGCSVMVGSLLTMLPINLLDSVCSIEEWTALRPCSLFWNSGLSRLYASTLSQNNVSPPTFGVSSMYMIVVPGGCSSLVTSLCQTMLVVRLARVLWTFLSPAPR